MEVAFGGKINLPKVIFVVFFVVVFVFDVSMVSVVSFNGPFLIYHYVS